MSTPSVIAMDNEQANLVIGQEIPITTGESLGANNANPFRTTARQEVGIKLSIVPQINEGNSVILNINQEVSGVVGPLTGTADLITTKRTIETTVLVDNNQVIVLGGLIDDDIPKPQIIAGVMNSNLRQYARRELKARGKKCNCINCRELWRAHIDPSTAELKQIKYRSRNQNR